jgi:cytosine/uracil/thiamine/allantoin permease
MNSSSEKVAFGLTTPAVISFVAYWLSQWLILLRATHEISYQLFWLSFGIGIFGITTSLICLFVIKIQSNRILACQIVNVLWLGYVFYSIVSFGPIGMQK